MEVEVEVGYVILTEDNDYDMKYNNKWKVKENPPTSHHHQEVSTTCSTSPVECLPPKSTSQSWISPSPSSIIKEEVKKEEEEEELDVKLNPLPLPTTTLASPPPIESNLAGRSSQLSQQQSYEEEPRNKPWRNRGKTQPPLTPAQQEERQMLLAKYTAELKQVELQHQLGTGGETKKEHDARISCINYNIQHIDSMLRERAKGTERQRRYRARATPAQVEARRARDAERKRAAYARETPEEAAARRANNAECKRTRYLTKGQEERRERYAKDALISKLRRLNESEEEKKARLAKANEYRKLARARLNERLKQTQAVTTTNVEVSVFRCNLCTTKPVSFTSEALLQIHNKHVHPTPTIT